MSAQSTADLPAPVRPTSSTWDADDLEPPHRAVLGDRDRDAVDQQPAGVRVGRERWDDRGRAGRGPGTTAALAARAVWMRTRQSRAPKVWASRSATSTQSCSRWPGSIRTVTWSIHRLHRIATSGGT